MPELPEARTIARRLHAAVAGRVIDGVNLRRRDMLKTGSPASLAALAGKRLHRVGSRGKYVVVHTSAGRLVMQLGMAGRILLRPPKAPSETHTHLVVYLDDGRRLHYDNVRRIAGGVHLVAGGTDDRGPLAALGPEATEISPERFVAALRKSNRPVKAALLDQSILAGLGNIYTDESLARAGIRPTRRAGGLSAGRLARLHEVIGRVLAEAVAAGGSTLSDANPFVDADGRTGTFAARHRVYGRYGNPCLTCGSELRRTIIAGRTTTYCPRCQV